jgi:hypothetical protein
LRRSNERIRSQSTFDIYEEWILFLLNLLDRIYRIDWIFTFPVSRLSSGKPGKSILKIL